MNINILFQNKTFRIEKADIPQDRSGNYRTKFFVDYHNGKNVTCFDSLHQAIAFANKEAYQCH